MSENPKKKIERLEAELSEYKQHFLMSLDMICIADINTSTFIKVNPAFETILGYSIEELLNKPYFEFIHPDDIEATKAVIEDRLRKGKKIISFDNRYRCKDGTYKWLNWVSQSDPELGINFAIARDISELKKNEKILKESNERFKSIFSSTNDGICLHEMVYKEGIPSDYRILEINPKYEEITGIKKEDAVGALASELYGAEEAPFLEKYYGVVEKKDPVNFESYFEPMDKYFKISVFTPGENQFATVFQDITDHKRSEIELRKTKKLLEETQSITRLGGWEFNVETEELLWTKETFHIHGISAENKPVDIKEALSFYSSEDAIKIDECIENAIKNGVPYDVEMQLKRADGKIIWIRTIGRPFVENGRVKRITGNIIDISERKIAEKEKENLQIQLLQAQKNQAIGTLAGGIAHDFNNILSGIFGYAQLAKMNSNNPDKVNRLIDSIVEGAKRASKLIQQILTFSRQKEFKKEDLELKTAVKEVVKLLRSSIPTTIELITDINSKSIIWADPTKIHQMIMNLGTNAYHSMKNSKGTLTVKLEDERIKSPREAFKSIIPAGDYVRIGVCDTGKGIDKDVQEKIFDPYYTTKKTGEGTGLGLALVHAIVQDHNGFIKVKSVIGEGTEFYIYLPVKEKDNKEVKQKKFNQSVIIKTGRILLVDDEEDILYTTSEILKRYGFKVIPFNNGIDALKAFGENPARFDLVITDMAMPKMGGDELAKKILDIRENIPVILCTGYTDKLRSEEAKEIGIRKFLLKPVSSEKLLKTISNLINIPE